MRHVFHCTPSELKAQDFRDIQAVLSIMDVEARMREFKERSKPGA